MSGIATATIGGALVSGYVQNKAGKRAAKTAEKTSENQIEYTEKQSNQARSDMNRLFGEASVSRNQGYHDAAQLFADAAPLTARAFHQGNMNAQETIAGSMPQFQNAILGNSVDYSFAQPKGIDMTQLNKLLSGVPAQFDVPNTSQTTSNVTQPQGSVQRRDVMPNVGGVGGVFSKLRNHLQNIR